MRNYHLRKNTKWCPSLNLDKLWTLVSEQTRLKYKDATNGKAPVIDLVKAVSLHNFTYAKCKVTFFIKHFLISRILYEGSTLINFGFLIKEDDMWYNFRLYRFKPLQYFHLYTKFKLNLKNLCKFDAIMSILGKIINVIELDLFFPISAKFENQTTYILSTIMK